MFKTDFDVLKRISDKREMAFYKTAKKFFSDARDLNIIILSTEFEDNYSFADRFNSSAFLEISHIDSLMRLERLGAKISMINKNEIFNLNMMACSENQKIRCLVYIKKTKHNSHVPFSLLFQGFYPTCNYFYNNQLRIIYSDTKEEKNGEIDYYVLNWGCGDFFIMLPLLYSLSKRDKTKFITDNNNIYNIFCKLGFKDIAELVYIPADSVYLIQGNHHLKSLHNAFTYDMFSKEQGVFETLCDYYRESGVINDLSYDEIFYNFKCNFPYKWSKHNHKRVKVAVQRLSSSTDLFGNSEKEWPTSEMNKLINYCKLNNIELINVCPHDEMKDKYLFDESDKNLLDLFPFLCEIDLFIGIDSAIGHMCALTGTPSLSLYFSEFDKHKHNFKFMPLSMNYTLFTKSRYPKVKDIIKEMNNILSGKRKLSDKFVPFIERQENVHYEFV